LFIILVTVKKLIIVDICVSSRASAVLSGNIYIYIYILFVHKTYTYTVILSSPKHIYEYMYKIAFIVRTIHY